MLMQFHDNLSFLRFERLCSRSGFVHAVTTRNPPGNQSPWFDLAWRPGDDPAPVRSRLGAVARALDADPGFVCCCRQVHGSSVYCIDTLPEADPAAPCRVCGDYDALITGRSGITLLVRVADCVPIVLYDPVRRVVAAIHAGWKGTVADIASATVTRMIGAYGCSPGDIMAGIGPAIGPCCFEVGDDVAERFRNMPLGDSCLVNGPGGGIRVDLPGANRAALVRCGLEPGNIEMSGYCTACSLDIFFSHRGEKGNTGRFGLFAGLAS